ncbi:MAG TPA: molybdopterin-dependent oxidoreductase [Candidatus Lokiarchaeia archaeon]|nr:molybdopterin-dependent oxidoreductase [Candidatus Lokiarchaeia archaeon]
MERKKFFCSICDASCGLIAITDNNTVVNIIPDKHHPVSKGYCCPKGLALHHVTNDPDRIIHPLKFDGGTWVQLSWKQAIGDIAAKFGAIRVQNGPHAIASHMGTNGNHSYSFSMYWKGFNDALGTRNCFDAGSVDNNNKFAAQYFMYGNSAVMPIPDLINADFLLLIGTNPAETNLNIAKCSSVMDKIATIAKRGSVVIIDPRNNETVKTLESIKRTNVKHHFIKPGTDTWLLVAMLNVIIVEGLIDENFINMNSTGYEQIKNRIASCTPTIASRVTGIPEETIAALAREFATTPRATIYARLGTCLVPHPTLNAWAIETLHVITGHLDKEGCAIFGHGPFNVAKVGRLIKLGEYDEWRSRIGHYPSVMGALPLGILAREITTPGTGQVRALIEAGGNIALTAPDSNAMLDAMKQLDIFVSIDFYRNETATLAAEGARVPAVYILPATTPLERENIPITYLNYNIVPHVEYHDAVILPSRAGPKQEWEIFLALTRAMHLVPFGNKMFGILAKALRFMHKEFSPGFLVGLLAIIGNIMGKHPPIVSDQAITLGAIKKKKVIVWKRHRYGVLKEFLFTGDKKVHLADPRIVQDLDRFVASIKDEMRVDDLASNEFFLIGRRHRKTMNSWLHNIPALWKERTYPRLLVNEEDALRLGMKDLDVVRLSNQSGELQVPVELTSDIMKGVLCYPHGWGHDKNGLTFARENAGANFNCLTSDAPLDPLSGMPCFDGIHVFLKKLVN